MGPATCSLTTGAQVLVVVRLKASEVAMSHALYKHKYIQEMVRIYNRDNLAEKCTLTLSLSVGHVDTFFVPPGAKSNHAFSVLERSVVTFLSHYMMTWQVLVGLWLSLVGLWLSLVLLSFVGSRCFLSPFSATA